VHFVLVVGESVDQLWQVTQPSPPIIPRERFGVRGGRRSIGETQADGMNGSAESRAYWIRTEAWPRRRSDFSCSVLPQAPAQSNEWYWV